MLLPEPDWKQVEIHATNSSINLYIAGVKVISYTQKPFFKYWWHRIIGKQKRDSNIILSELAKDRMKKIDDDK
jgi:hypothetical protein